MPEKNEWNNIALNNNGSPLHSWEWGLTKELSGFEIAWFFCNESNLRVAAPLVIKKIGPWRLAWLPDGLRFSGETSLLRDKLAAFLAKHKIALFVTRFMDYMCNSQELAKFLIKVPWPGAIQTFVLNLDAAREDEILQSFNATTRKHIKKAEREGYEAVDLQPDDYEVFWSGYEEFATQRGFGLPLTKKQYRILLEQASCADKQSGLRLIAKKIVKDKSSQGFMLCLRFGKRCLELIRLDYEHFKQTKFGPKYLSWAVIKQAMKDGVGQYDFGGVDLKKQPGVFQFKKGFAGQSSKLSSPLIKVALR